MPYHERGSTYGNNNSDDSDDSEDNDYDNDNDNHDNKVIVRQLFIFIFHKRVMKEAYSLIWSEMFYTVKTMLTNGQLVRKEKRQEFESLVWTYLSQHQNNITKY